MMSGGFNMMGPGLAGWGGSGFLGGLGMVFMGLVPLLLIGLVVWAVVEATRRRDDRPASGYYVPGPGAPMSPVAPVPSSARALLDERYARGELGRDEYLQRRGDVG